MAHALETPRDVPVTALSFDAVYAENVAFVWRVLRTFGVSEAQLEDAVQDVFVVVRRRLPEFEGRSSLKTWLFAIALRVAQSMRRSVARQAPGEPALEAETEAELAPDVQADRSRAVELGVRLLNELDADKRTVFILAELEQLPASEIGEALGIPLFTVYSRLRAARREFNAALARERARGAWRSRWTS